MSGKDKPYVEAGDLFDGTRVFRMNCPKCARIGVWLQDLNAVERSVSLHEKHEHAQRAVA